MTHVKDPVVRAVIRRLEERSAIGMSTYGKTMEENPAGILFWIDSAIEEALDLANYLQKMKHVLCDDKASKYFRDNG